MGATRKSTSASSASNAGLSRDIRKAVGILSEAVQTLNDAFFGRWDKEKNEEVPGIVESIKKINQRLDVRDVKDAQRDRQFRWAALGLGSLIFIGAASAIGVPTKEIAPAASAFWQYVANHAGFMPPP